METTEVVDKTLTEIKESTPEMPVLGYTVIASLDPSLEVHHDDLKRYLTQYGFSADSLLPPMPEARTYIRRGITAWLKEIAKNGTGTSIQLIEEDATGRKNKPLVREIRSRDKNLLVLALVTENIDLDALGLSYLTNLRVFYVKPQREAPGTLMLTLTASGAHDPLTYAPDAEEQTLLDNLQKHVDHYQVTYKTQELTRMSKKIIESLSATTMRQSGGVYFVPYANRERLTKLKQLTEILLSNPDGKNTSTLMHIPIMDEVNSRTQVAASAHQTFLAKTTAFEHYMQRFLTDPENRKRGIHKDLMQANIKKMDDFKAELDLYNKLLGVQKEEIETRIDDLENKAQELITLYAIGVKHERETAGVTVKPLPIDEDDEDEDDE